jgi:hypothetical protein
VRGAGRENSRKRDTCGIIGNRNSLQKIRYGVFFIYGVFFNTEFFNMEFLVPGKFTNQIPPSSLHPPTSLIPPSSLLSPLSLLPLT